MIIRRYRNGVLVTEEVTPPPKPSIQPTQPVSEPPVNNGAIQTPKPITPSPKKGCGCGRKK
jgi:hypothetical protein